MTATAVSNGARISHDGLLTLTVERADVVRQKELLIFHNRLPFRVLLRRREYRPFIDVRPVDEIAENGDGERIDETAALQERASIRTVEIRVFDFMILGIGPVETTFGVVDRQAVRQAEIFLNEYGSIGAVHEAAFDFLATPIGPVDVPKISNTYYVCALSQKNTHG